MGSTHTSPRVFADERAANLRIYINDHRAASSAGLSLCRRMERNNRGTPLGAALYDLTLEIRSEAVHLDRLAEHLGVQPNWLKRAGAVVGERLARLKLNGRIIRYSPLSRVLEIEALMAGVDAKHSLWSALRDAGVGRGICDYDALLQSARKQREVLATHHGPAAREAFGVADVAVIDRAATKQTEITS